MLMASLKKDRGHLLLLIGRGDGTEKMDCPILVSPPTPPPPAPNHFSFCSAAAANASKK